MSPQSVDAYPSTRPPMAVFAELGTAVEPREPTVDSLIDCMDCCLKEDNYKEWYRVKSFFESIPPAQIIEEYGRDLLLWLALNKDSSAGVEPLAKALQVDPSLIVQAQTWCWQVQEERLVDEQPTGKYLLSQFKIMEYFESGGLDCIDATKLIKECTKEGAAISQKRANSYELEPLRSEGRGERCADGYASEWLEREVIPEVVYSIWLDAPTGFILKYKGRPQSVVGVAARPDNGEPMVYQLQGVQGKKVDFSKKWEMHPEVGEVESKDYVIGKACSRGLAPLDWQRLMISVTEEVTANLGQGSIWIQSGKNNKWANIRDNAEKWHLDKEVAKKTYDETAQRLGFTPDPADGNWRKDL